MVPVLVLGHFGTLARPVSDSVPTPVPAPWNKHTKTIKNLWLYTTGVLLTKDACDIRNIYSKKLFKEKRILYIQLDLNKIYVTKMYGTTNIKLK
jgi:hypothetical protein